MVTVKWKYSIPFFIFLLIPLKINGIAIDNDIIGEPDIECLDQEIRVWVKTRKQFAGRIYAKGKADDPDCFKDDFGQQRTKKPHFDLSLGMCGMKSLRSFDPRGMYYGITLVISFHPLFITKVDQAFHVKCFFEEANRGLTAELGVSMIPTTEVEARHGIPGCTYSIHRSSIDDLDSGRPPGAPIQFAKIGDRVLHQWHCDDQMFGVLINNCYVTDGVNKRAEVIDSRGCPVDPILITGIRYSPDSQRAYAESQVFKFADRPGIWFFCQIQMCMKKEGMCKGITPPACAGGTVGTHSPSFGNNLIDDENDNGGGGGDGTGDTEESLFTQRPRKNLKKSGSRKIESENADEEVEEYNGEDFNRRETYQTTKKSKTDYEDGDFHAKPRNGNKSNKQRIPPGYGISTNPDYDLHAKEPATVFGPAINPGSESAQKVLPFGSLENGSQKNSLKSEIVSTEFETDDDLATVTATPGIASSPTTSSLSLLDGSKSVVAKDAKKDYVDYDSDVTIPPNLTDLLANLPEDINADSLQKMFKDSVADRRALLQGFDMLINKMKHDKNDIQKSSEKPIGVPPSKKVVGRMPGEKIDTMHVTWESQRMARDLPLSTDTIPSDVITEDPNGPPLIAGQLMIYDLDETPPPSSEEEEQQQQSSTNAYSECAISRQGFLVLAMALGSLASVMIFVIIILYLKVKRISKDEDLLLYPSFDSSQKSFQQSNNDSINSSSSTVSVFRQPMSSRQSHHSSTSSHISQRRSG
uniref:ZP domain-containing protein n=1 Tax=Panagrolaimus sp. PS1159 TaxID=55785 RepID=A0AC35FHK5_9BILA